MHEFLSQARFSRDHRWAPLHMSEYLDGELATRGRDRMERHLGECVECRRLIAGLRALMEALPRLPAPQRSRDPRQLAVLVRQRLEDLRPPDLNR